jgi:hypothetical protein
LCGGVGITALTDCSTGSNPDSGDSSGTSTFTSEEKNPVNFRVDFVDGAGTIQHVAEAYSSENESERVVNNYSEDDWQKFKHSEYDVSLQTLDMALWALRGDE